MDSIESSVQDWKRSNYIWERTRIPLPEGPMVWRDLLALGYSRGNCRNRDNDITLMHPNPCRISNAITRDFIARKYKTRSMVTSMASVLLLVLKLFKKN